MGPSVRITGGPAYELLLGAVAVADAGWRSVLTHGGQAYDAARAAGGAALARDVARFGRFGWINLLGPLAEQRGRGRDDLVGLVAEQAPRALRYALVGGRRCQLHDVVDGDVLDAALDGVPGARRELRRALTSEHTVLEIAPWLLATRPADVKRVCLRVLRALPDPPHTISTRRTASVLRTQGPAHLVELVAPGVQYADGSLGATVLVTSRAVAPVVTVVDEPDATVIVHPPLDDAGPTDASIRLRDLARAAGDQTRIRLLQELRSGPRTLSELCEGLSSPRTTLLHHLALLRATGLIEIAVVGWEPNVYQLRHEGFDEFVRAVRGFTIGSQLSINLDT
jgi:DNA-binding transcriptional ArsR family regulator